MARQLALTNRRAGLSLAEVLIAIFVLALGLLGVLSLFPLGAVRMAQAIKDDRTATESNNFAGMMRWYWRDEVTGARALGNQNFWMYQVNNPPASTPQPSPNRDRLDPIWNAMEDVNYPFNPDLGPAGAIPPSLQCPPALQPPNIPRNWHGSSYVVFVDPIGWNAYDPLSPQRYWLAGNVQTIPRRSLRRVEYLRPPGRNQLYQYTPDTGYPAGINQTTGQPYPAVPPGAPSKIQLLNRYFTLMDDIGYGRDGSPTDSTGTTTAAQAGPANVQAMLGQIQRDGRYTCSFMLRRQDNRIFREADMTIVVYSGRSIDTPSAETAYSALFTKGSTEATILYTGLKPNLRKGNWIFDSTMSFMKGQQRMSEPHGFFYRIVGVNDDVDGVLRLELQEPAIMSTMYPDGSPYGVGVVMENVVEVFSGKALTTNVRPVP